MSGSAGSYIYGDSAHPHAVTSTSNGYSATYDAAGNLLCRALTTTTTCRGATPSGQQLSYDAQGRLSLWQDQASAPTQTVNYLYDGSGSRVATQSTANGSTTLTSYIGSIEEVQTTGSSTQATTYYAVAGKRVAADVNGTFYSFGYDALGSQVAVLDTSGNLVGAQLYGPYGASRYNTGTLPTSIWFTGQRADSVTGLDYYNARYYDPGVGQFLSVDSVQGNAQGMDPYAYVGGNPESRTDPTGNHPTCSDDGSCNDGAGSSSGGGIDFQPPRQNNGGNTGGSGGTTTTPQPTPTPHPTPTKTPVKHKQQPSNDNGCDSKCETDKLLIDKYLEDQLQRKEAGVSLLADTASLFADLVGMGYDADIFGAELLDLTSFLVHLGQFAVDIATYMGASVPGWLSYIVGLANTVINGIDTLKGVLEFFNPGGLIAKLTDPLISTAKRFLEAQGATLVPGLSQLVGGATNQTLAFLESRQEDQVADYTTSQAYSICQQYIAAPEC